jgi:hypothetical protein
MPNLVPLSTTPVTGADEDAPAVVSIIRRLSTRGRVEPPMELSMFRFTMVAALGCGVLSLAVAASAAGLESQRLRAHVPFAFEVGSTRLPAGNYSLSQAEDAFPDLLELRSPDAGRGMFVFVTDAGTRSATQRPPELLFDRIGNERYLRAVKLADGARELLPASADEVHEARKLAVRSTAVGRP